MNYNNKSIFKQKVLNIIIYIILPIWVLLTLFFLYKYILFTSNVKVSKGGTVIEGIFDKVSYLPYWGDSMNDEFYKSIVFPKCVDYKLSGDYINYSGFICDINTKDYKKFYIKIKSGYYWSDGQSISIDDIFFTYNKILKNNKWNLGWDNKYANIDVIQIDNNTISVIFPNSSVDNMIFFTNNLLPSHILQSASLEQYVEGFSHNPVVLSGISISPVQDKNSFVYDLTQSKDTFISYYQLKKFDDIKQLNDNKGLVVDIYKNQKQLPNYIKYSLLSDNYLILFFNSKSKKFNKRIKRALGGLIVNKLYTGSVDNILHKTHLYFDAFLSNGKGIEKYLEIYNPNLDFDKKDLDNLKIGQLPPKIIIDKEKKKFIYYLDELTGTKKIDIGIYSGEQYKKLTIETPSGSGEKNIKLNKRHYILNIDNGDIKEGANKYRIWGWRMMYNTKQKKKILTKRNIVDIDIYFIPKEHYIGKNIPLNKKLRIIYFKDDGTKEIVKSLSKIFRDNDIIQYFVFIGYDNIKDFEQQINSKNYDILIRTLSLGLKKDLSDLFITDNPVVNPSLFVNTDLSSNINNYLLYKNSNFDKALKYKKNIDAIYGRDLPFIILGQVKENIYIHKNIKTYPFGLNNIYTFHKYLYNNLKIKKHYKVSFDNFANIDNFQKFIDGIIK